MKIDDEKLVDGLTIEVCDLTGNKSYVRLRAGPADWGVLPVPWYYRIGWWFKDKYYGAWPWLLKKGVLTKMAEIDEYNSADKVKR